MSARTLLAGGVERTWSLHLPAGGGAGRDGRMPLVIDLHASSIGPQEQLAITGLLAAADAHGFAVAAPAAVEPYGGGGTTWRVPPAAGQADDVGFVAALIDHLTTRFRLDPARVFLFGFSGGGRLASHLAAVFSDRVAGIAVAGGLQPPPFGSAVHLAHRRPQVLAFHGTADPVNPYDPATAPSRPAYWTSGFEAAVAAWRAAMGLAAPAEVLEPVPGVERRRWQVEGRDTLVAYRLEGTGHVWPGARFPWPEYVGAADDRLDATGVALDLFGLR